MFALILPLIKIRFNSAMTICTTFITRVKISKSFKISLSLFLWLFSICSLKLDSHVALPYRRMSGNFGWVIWTIALTWSETRPRAPSSDKNGTCCSVRISFYARRGDFEIWKFAWNFLNSEQRVFNGWNEAPISFAPTYKYDYGTDIYDSSEKARIPAYCYGCTIFYSLASNDSMKLILKKIFKRRKNIVFCREVDPAKKWSCTVAAWGWNDRCRAVCALWSRRDQSNTLF